MSELLFFSVLASVSANRARCYCITAVFKCCVIIIVITIIICSYYSIFLSLHWCAFS